MGRQQQGLSIIDKGCQVEGTLNIIDAQAKVREMIIGGECQGDITVYENLRILSTGVFSGNMMCKNIELEAGGKIDGRVRLIDSTEEPSRTGTILATNRVNPPPLTG
ncbi:MAG: polymer-forming cytoskeletal protein [Deltaproteobacteria bacterium]|nr:polymer-forming cytoskeletal protein [Deltaproteobacteria bacterium]